MFAINDEYRYAVRQTQMCTLTENDKTITQPGIMYKQKTTNTEQPDSANAVVMLR